MDAAERELRLARLTDDPESAELSAVDLSIVRYAKKLTSAPASVCAADVADLRLNGLDDRAIHDLCSIVAYYAFVNRIADGLGVEMETTSGEE
jgi:uncharacterized peroxidase-related enzyme